MSELMEVVLYTYLYKVMSQTLDLMSSRTMMSQTLDFARVSLKWHLVKLFHHHLVPLEDALYG